MEKKANAYKELGPLGSGGPSLPVDVPHRHAVRYSQSPDPSLRWKKATIYKLSETLDSGGDSYTPSRGSSACHSRIRPSGEICMTRDAFRAKESTKIRTARDEIKRMIQELCGIDYGVTIGLTFGDSCSV